MKLMINNVNWNNIEWYLLFIELMLMISNDIFSLLVFASW
jgi:hypothetical protein